ncbi:uncharacterized protein [Haliotis cracherodii]|uniref:uncharacterized protein n=1 Tax=Haliotis cracherodii TaxID=6455 RepID=UPI0039E9BFA7
MLNTGCCSCFEMAVSYSKMLLILLAISVLCSGAATSDMNPERDHPRTGKPRQSKSAVYLLADKRSAEFVPSDRVYGRMTSYLSKRLHAPFGTQREDRRSSPRPDSIPGIDIIASMTRSLNKLRSRKADGYSVSDAPGASAEDSHTMNKTQMNQDSHEDKLLAPSTADHANRDAEVSSSKYLFLQKLIENAVRVLYLSVNVPAPTTYPFYSAHQVQLPGQGHGFMKRKAKPDPSLSTEGKRPFDRLASGATGKRFVSNKRPFDPLASSLIGKRAVKIPSDAQLQKRHVDSLADDLKRKRGAALPSDKLFMKRPFDPLANGLIGKRFLSAEGPAK